MATMSISRTTPDLAAVKAVRQFNRFYTARAGVLEPYLGSELSLTDVRVLYELAHRESAVASELGKALGLETVRTKGGKDRAWILPPLDEARLLFEERLGAGRLFE